MIHGFSSTLLAPATILVLWTLLVLLWMMARRFSAFKEANIDLAKAPPGGRGQNLEGVLPAKANWPSHNYTHLLEQPTLFYALVMLLTLMGQTTQFNAALAWIYVAIRIVHSLWQVSVNTIPVRFTLFAASTIMLLLLAVNAVRAAFA
tara:strand:- start:48618 stop:49061 length:444 start_codon:yes stop_codon:yes gene_type:complete